MRGKQILLFLLVFVLIGSLAGCNTQKNAADTERLRVIEEKIADLYNEDKTDIIEEMFNEQVLEIEALLADEKDNVFSEENLALIDSLLFDLDTAIELADFSYRVDALFDAFGGVLKDAPIEEVELALETYEDRIVYYERQTDKITEAKDQLLFISEVTEIVDALFTDGQLNPDVDLDREREVRELVDQIKSIEVKRELDSVLMQVVASLTKERQEVAAAEQAAQEAAERRRIDELAKEQETKVESKPVEKAKESKKESKVAEEPTDTTKANEDEGASGKVEPTEVEETENIVEEEPPVNAPDPEEKEESPKV